MEAVVNLLNYPKIFHGFIHEPIPLQLEFMGKPILTMAIEACVHLNAKRIHILAHNEDIKRYQVISELGCWGDLIHYISLDQVDSFLQQSNQNQFLCAWPFSLPRFDQHQQLMESLFNVPKPTKLINQSKDTGWAIINAKDLLLFAEHPFTFNIDNHLELPFHFIIDDYQSYYEAHFHALRDSSMAVYFPPTASNIEDHIWVSNQSGVAPSATIRENVFIGVGCRIEPYAQIGPNCIIANHCVVGAYTQVKNSVIESSVYVGDHLRLSDSIVGRHLIFALKDKMAVPVQDELIISRWKPLSIRATLKKIAERVTAGLLLCLLSPIMLISLMLFPLRRTVTIVFPAPMHPSLWRYYRWLSFVLPWPLKKIQWLVNLPSLIHVITGKCRLFGSSKKALSFIKKAHQARHYEDLTDKVGLFSY